MSKPAQTTPFRRQIDFDQKEFIGERELQEDYSVINFLKQQTELLFVLADGMGGHAGGEVASKTAVDTFVKTFVEYPSESIPAKLGAALQQANNELSSIITAQPDLDGMGCTLVGMHIGSQGVNWISVGDSPLFLIRKNQIIRLNEDHSMAPLIEKSLLEGKISQEEANNHPHRHVLRSAVTGGELTLIDTPPNTYGLFAGDIVILASDGVLTLSDDEILRTVKGVNAVQADSISSAILLAVRAKRRQRQDNTTVQVFVVPDTWKKGGGTGNTSLWLALAASFFAIAGGLGYYLTIHPEGSKLLSTQPEEVTEVKPQPVELPPPSTGNKENENDTSKSKVEDGANSPKDKKEPKESKETKPPKAPVTPPVKTQPKTGPNANPGPTSKTNPSGVADGEIVVPSTPTPQVNTPANTQNNSDVKNTAAKGEETKKQEPADSTPPKPTPRQQPGGSTQPPGPPPTDATKE